MNLTPIKANMTELEINGMKILFSYQTPVAMMNDHGIYKTEKRWSNTTTRHINTWFKDYLQVQETKPQEFFDNLLKEVKI